VCDLSDALTVLAHYPGEFRPEQIEMLGAAGGFSGAVIWRVSPPDRVLCLKRWPAESPSVEGMQFIHAVLLHVARQGFGLAPAPCQDRRGQTFVTHREHLWELTPWLPGMADFRQNPQPSRLQAALRVLAEFHRAAATYPEYVLRTGRSPGVRQRLQRVRRYAAGDLEQLGQCIVPEIWPDLCDRARQAVTRARFCLGPVKTLLETACDCELPLQPCIRDVWHDHVLFTGDRVTGLIDFGAMQIESIAADVARLLGSLARDDASLWRAGLAAYESIRPMHQAEKALVTAFDRSGILLGALNWVEWLYRERREFHAPDAVARRLDEVLTRLDDLERIASSAGGTATHAGLWCPDG
jgi:Ser/Thr protein kinase RdoA (MazF antagonist)